MHTDHLPPSGLDASGPVQGEIPCRSCGYLLKGLPATGRCPECGVAVAVSLHGDSLAHASPRWLTRAATGFRLAQVASTLLLLLLFPGTCCLSALAPGATSLLGYCAVIAALWTVGLWNATTPEPGKPPARLRTVAAVLCGCSAMAQISIAGIVVGSTLSENAMLLWLVLELALMAACWSVHMRIADDLKKRIRHPDRIGPVRFWVMLAVISLGAALLVLAAEWLSSRGMGGGPTFAALLVTALLGYASLIGSAFVFANAANMLRSYAIVGRANWHDSALQAAADTSPASAPGAAPPSNDPPDHSTAPPPSLTP